ncbi:MAG: serine hydrolase domain-containing protein [Hyphomicrobiaceae bacterium]
MQQSDHSAPELPSASPRDWGLDPTRLRIIRDALQREIDAGRLPGSVIAIARRGRLLHLDAIGQRDPATGAAITTDSIFAIASMTKPMTSVAILGLAEEGRMALGDPVSRYIPELANLRVVTSLDPTKLETRPPARIPTIQDLLRHSSGFTYRDNGTSAAHKKYPPSSIGGPIKLTKAETIAALAESPLLFDPGTNWTYGYSTDVLGFVVEAVTGKALGDVLQDRIWSPLAMTDTTFALTDAQRLRYARPHAKDVDTGITNAPLMHDIARDMKWHAGGGGAVSTVMDYIRFAEMLRRGGTLGSVRILGPNTVAHMTSDHLPNHIEDRIADTMDPAASGYGFGLGVAVRRSNGVSAIPGTKGDYYWSGVYGTYFWIDPIRELSVVHMAITPGPARLRYRQLIRQLVYQAMTE